VTAGERPAWLQNLHHSDRAVAERWLNEIGEARFQRIARAAATTQRHRGNPGVDDSRLVRDALTLWIRDRSVRRLEDAANRIASRVCTNGNWQGRPPIGRGPLARKLRDEIRNISAKELLDVEQDTLDKSEPSRFSSTKKEPYYLTLGSISHQYPGPFPRATERGERLLSIGRFMRAFPSMIDPQEPIGFIAQLHDEVVAKLKARGGH
jgi:hypothetical protein